MDNDYDNKNKNVLTIMEKRHNFNEISNKITTKTTTIQTNSNKKINELNLNRDLFEVVNYIKGNIFFFKLFLKRR